MSERVKKVLVVVTADPRENGRAAEAVRLAAGVGGWEKVAVKLCLCGEARRVLSEMPDEFVNGEVFASYLPLLLEGEPRVFVLADETEEAVLTAGGRQVSLHQLAALGREADSVLRF